MPRASCRRAAVFGPMPHKTVAGRSRSFSSTSCSQITARPSGFCRLAAIFARGLFGPALAAVGDVHVRLVQTHRLDQRRILAQHAPQFAGELVIGREVHGEEDGIGTALVGGAQRHRRVDAVGAGLIGRGGDHAALVGVAVTADDDGFPTQFWAAELLDGREEGVQVDMQDDTGHGGWIRREGEMFRLDGQRALVTGGTSGIGEAAARVLLQAGARVVIAARGEERGAEAQERLRPHGEVHFIPADVSAEESVRRLIARTASVLGGLDILVNGAGIISRTPVHEMETADWSRILDTVLTGVFLCSREALPHLRESGGAIVNVASYLAFRAGTARTPAYNAAKAGVVSLTTTMAAPYGPDGVRINAVCPGFVPTALNRTIWAPYTDAQRDQIAQRYPLRRVGTPEDVAYAVLFLASKEAGWITGVSLLVDGGLTTR